MDIIPPRNNLLPISWLHCNPLQGHYRVELLHREIPVVITGNGFAVCDFSCHFLQQDGSTIWPIFKVNGLDWQCCLACSSEHPPGF